MTFAPCDAAGKIYQVEAFGREEPAEPADGQLFLKVEDADHPWRYDSTLEMYSKNSGSWAAIPLEYCRITAAGLGKLFRQWDTVTVQGTAAQQANSLCAPAAVMRQYSSGTAVQLPEDALYSSSVLVLAHGCSSSSTFKKSCPSAGFSGSSLP